MRGEIFKSRKRRLKASLHLQVGRKVQGAAGHKGKDPEEHRGQKGTSDQFATWTQCHHAGTTILGAFKQFFPHTYS